MRSISDFYRECIFVFVQPTAPPRKSMNAFPKKMLIQAMMKQALILISYKLGPGERI